MIHDPEKKVILLLPPKTGSTSLRSLFGSMLMAARDLWPNTIVATSPADGPPRIQTAAMVRAHVRYEDISQILPDINLDEYSVYSFYREPVARFMSTFKYMQHQILTDLNVKAQSGDAKELRMVYKALYNDEDITRDPHSITVDDIISTIEKNILDAPMLDLFLPQTLYLTDKVTLLNFDDFENNAAMLLEVFGYNVIFGHNIDVSIPKHNDTNSANYLSDLTEEQVTKIKEIYAVDYAFFESRNITF